MPSGQATDEMAAVRSKIASLEITMQMQHAKRDKEAAWEKRDREAGKKELEVKIRSMEMETRAAQKEMRAERKDLEQKMELMKMHAAIENEKRDRKDLERNMEIMKMQAAHALENEKRDRDAALEKKETQHQIEQLRWEARFGQMEQQLAAQRTTSSLVQPVQRILNPSPTLHGEREHLLLQQLLELKLQSNESTNSQPPHFLSML
jgi:hypothetical protein